MRAKPSPWIKDYPFLIRYLLHVFPTATRGLSDRPLDPFGVPSDESCPSNKQRIIPHTNIPPSPSGLGVMGQGPNKTTCIRRFPKGDRKALWSPVRAKPHLAQKISSKGKTYIKTIPQARQGLGKWVKGQWPLRGCWGQRPRPGCRGGAPAGVQGQRPRLGVQRAKPSGRVWGGAPHRGVGDEVPDQGRGPCHYLCPLGAFFQAYSIAS